MVFPLDGHALSYFDTAADGWTLPDGEFTVYVGDSSALENLPRRQSFTVTRTVGARQVTLDVPSSTTPDSTFTATATFNNDGDYPLTDVRALLHAPASWTVTLRRQPPAWVAAHQPVTVSWTVKVPASAQNTSGALEAIISGSTAGGAPTPVASQTSQVAVQPVVEAQAPATAPLLNPGKTVTEAVQLTNRLAVPVTVTLAPQAPTGVTINPNPAVVTVPADGIANATLTIGASSQGAGNYTIPVNIIATARGATYTETPAGLPVNVAYSSLAAAFDNTGIADASDPASANYDGHGYSYSQEGLTAAGLAPGATVTHDGITYIWPSSAPGTPDNVVAAGQAIALSGSGSELGFLGASNNGNATGPVTVIYADGTTSTAQVSFADWYSNAAATGGDILATEPNWNQPPGGIGNHPVSVYAYTIPLDPNKTVADVILPTAASEAPSASSPMHVFAIGIG